MAEDVNTVVVGGRLTSDPELRTLQSGTSLCKLRVANNRRRKVNDEWVDSVGYYDVSVFGARGETVAKWLSRGSALTVVGELSWREWDGEHGKRQAVEIKAREVVFGPKASGDDGAPRQRRDELAPDTAGLDEYRAAAGEARAAPASDLATSEDDIPF